MALPQNDFGSPEFLCGEPTIALVWVKDHAFIKRNAQFEHCCVASEVLIGQEKDFLALVESPFKCALGIGRRAHRSTMATGKGLDRGGAVHVSNGNCLIGDAGVGEDGPGFFYLRNGGHVGHGTTCGEVRKDDLLGGLRENVSAFGHEVHAAKHDVWSIRVRGCELRKLERVAGDVSKGDDVIALIVVPENEHLITQSSLRGSGSLDQVRVTSRGQIAWAFHAALATGIRGLAEDVQFDGGHVFIVPQG
ncbi:unannotated protein [freshwater metagenome]|uniref:Unannotated protein n=1 Tax=freshwater metagenome TaxID=449393 RepID=A0A6J6BFL8_9ZZZZ